MLKPHHHTYQILKSYLDFRAEDLTGKAIQKYTGRIVWASDRAVHIELKPSGVRTWVPFSQILKMEEIDEFRVELTVTDWIFQQKKEEILNKLTPVETKQ